MARCKYFTDEETNGLLPDICYKLDRTREFFGGPIELTCGYRSPEHNAEVGGVSDSAHVTGMAVDVKAPKDPAMREKLMWAAGLAGFNRAETAPNHFHFDIDKTKPNPCFWQGTDH